MKSFADIALPLPIHVLTYRVPLAHQSRISIGSSVLVPLRTRKLVVGIVVQLHDQKPDYTTKELLGLVYEAPLVSLGQLQFLKWISEYYIAYLGEVLYTALPKEVQRTANIVFKRNPTPIELPTDPDAQSICNLLSKGTQNTKSIKQYMGKKATDALLLSLLSKQWMQVSPKPLNKIAPSTTPCSPPSLPSLTQAQHHALVAIQSNFTQKEVVLLYGAIGSGKTMLYTQLIQEALTNNKQILLLLPEISLVTHIAERIKPLFGAWMVVYHSKQPPTKRLHIWSQLMQGHALLVVGTRSSLFLPFKQLHLIIVDEEHDTAYKQTDSPPTYHARDSSIVLAKQHQAKVLLGSATPAIETYYNAQTGKYGYVSLPTRFGNASSPDVSFIDLNAAQSSKAMRDAIALPLLEALKQNLQQGGQAMLFQNRRGYTRYFVCASCGWIPHCIACSVGLTYHQEPNRLICHYCGYSVAPFAACTTCGTNRLHAIGFGTERIEESVQFMFPNQRIGRMDLDSTKRKNAHQSLLQQVDSGSIAILVGTQMIAKGLDFANIRLIGVIDIDALLYFPDFRANERCFQLITQLAGRAGRRDEQGKVLIQTRQPHHPLFQHVSGNDYLGMYETELQERKKFAYPPYSKLIKITLYAPTETWVTAGALALKQALAIPFGNRVLGPQKPLVGKIRNLFLNAIYIKISTKTASKLQEEKKTIQNVCHRLLNNKTYRRIKIAFDVDPV